MNTQLSSTLAREHEQPRQPQATRVVNRPNAIDRVALQLGLFLIMWGRRPRPALERRATKRELRLAQRAHETLHERVLEHRINQRWL